MIATQRKVVVLHQTLAIVPLFLNQFMMGIGIGWLAPMLYHLKNSPEVAFTSEDCAWIAALHYASRGFMSIFAFPLIDRLGRNMFFIIASSINLVIWIVVYSTLNVYVHYAVRLLFGLAVGFHDMASGIYIGENCSPSLRGIFSGFFLASFYLGEVVEFLLAACLSYEWVAICNGALGLFTILMTLLLLKEPAHYLILKGKLTKAEKNFDWLHDLRDPAAKHEFEDIKNYVLKEKGRAFSWELLRCKEVYKSMRLVLIISLLCYLAGYSAVNSFVTMALTGSKGLSNAHMTIFFGVVLFMAIMSSSPFLEKFNRRTLYLGTCAVISIIHAATATLYCFQTVYDIPHFHWILFALLTAFMSVHGMIIFPLVTVTRGELFPQNVKALGSCLAGIFGSIGGFVGAKIFLPISEAYGTQTNFILFSLISLTMFLYIYYDLPETKGKTLTDIQRELRGDKKEETFARGDEIDSSMENRVV